MRTKARWKSVVEFMFSGVAVVVISIGIVSKFDQPIGLGEAIWVAFGCAALYVLTSVAIDAWREI